MALPSKISPAELIVNKDGSIYHLHLKPEHVADTVIIVGDQARVKRISRHFDSIEYKLSNREFITHTGMLGTKRITVASTGIGTDNMDIFINELDAAVNIDLKTRKPRKKLRSLKIIRLGTSGALQPDIDVGSFVLSDYAMGMDSLPYHYGYTFTSAESELSRKLNDHVRWDPRMANLYVVKGSDNLKEALSRDMIAGITATATGFYAPQGRTLRIPPAQDHVIDRFASFRYDDLKINNLEMETSALFSLGKMLGHECITCCAILANRANDTFINNHDKAVDNLIRDVLTKIIINPLFD